MFCHHMCFVKNVGAGTGSARMKISIEWRVETEVQLVVLRTILQDWEKSIGIFLLFQDFIALWFLLEILRLIAR